MVFDFDVKLNLHFADASEVTDVVEFSDEAHALSGEHGLSELHLVHAVVHEHLDVLDFDDLFPEVGQKAEGEIAVDDGLSEGYPECLVYRQLVHIFQFSAIVPEGNRLE